MYDSRCSFLPAAIYRDSLALPRECSVTVARRSLAYVIIGKACYRSSCLLAVIVAVRDRELSLVRAV